MKGTITNFLMANPHSQIGVDVKDENGNVEHWVVEDAGTVRARHAVHKGFQEMPEHVKKKLQEEIDLLEHELNHELPAELKKAVALGDLSENAEYHMAKQRQEFVRARLGMMKKRMAELSLMNLANIPRDRAALGSTLVVFDSTKDEEIVYKLVTSEESDVTKGMVSTTSPIGRSLMGKKVGDVTTVVTPGGTRELEVLKLTTMHDGVDKKTETQA